MVRTSGRTSKRDRKYFRKDERTLAARFEEHRREIHERIMKEHPELAQRFKERRHRLDEHLKERRPEVMIWLSV